MTWGGKLLGVLALLIVGAIVATVLKSLVHKLLDKAQLDKHADKFNVKKFLPNIGLTDLLVKIVYWAIYLFFIAQAVNILQISQLSEVITESIGAIPQIFLAAVILIGGAFLARFVKQLVEGYGDKLSESHGEILGNVAYGIVIYFAIITAFEQIKFIGITPITNNINTLLIGLVAAAALALGLGGRSLAASLVGHRFIKDSLTTGDKVSLGEVSGTVVNINAAVVTVETENGKVVVPISDLV